MANAFLTPETLEGTPVCYPINIPESLYRYLQGALFPLSLERNWEQHGSVTPLQAADYWHALLEGLDRGCDMTLPTIVGTLAETQAIPNNAITGLPNWDIPHTAGLDWYCYACDLDVAFEVVNAGQYLVSAQIRWQADSNETTRLISCSVDLVGRLANRIRSSQVGVTTHGFSGVISIPAGAKVRFEAFQNSGGALNAETTQDQTRVSLVKVA